MSTSSSSPSPHGGHGDPRGTRTAALQRHHGSELRRDRRRGKDVHLLRARFPYLSGRHDFVMKMDDDVWLHLPNLEKRLRSVQRNGAYFGRDVRATDTWRG